MLVRVNKSVLYTNTGTFRRNYIVILTFRQESVISSRCTALWPSFSRIRSSVFLFAPSDQMLRRTQTPEKKKRSLLLWRFNSSKLTCIDKRLKIRLNFTGTRERMIEKRVTWVTLLATGDKPQFTFFDDTSSKFH